MQLARHMQTARFRVKQASSESVTNCVP